MIFPLGRQCMGCELPFVSRFLSDDGPVFPLENL